MHNILSRTFLNKNKVGGYTMLFTVLLITIITSLAVGISNTTIKQQLLSSIAIDSQTAFYMADGGMECAIYNYYKNGGTLPSSFNCVMAKPVSGNASETTLSDSGSGVYKFSEMQLPGFSEPCFELVTVSSGGTVEKITAKGYNTCNSSSSRRLERSLEVTFQ